jgi:hypothetical protein
MKLQHQKGGILVNLNRGTPLRRFFQPRRLRGCRLDSNQGEPQTNQASSQTDKSVLHIIPPERRRCEVTGTRELGTPAPVVSPIKSEPVLK